MTILMPSPSREVRRAAIFAIAERFVSTISLVACMIFHGALNLSLAVIDTEQTSMAAQYAGFGATILISTGLAAVLLVRARGWFFGEAAR